MASSTLFNLLYDISLTILNIVIYIYCYSIFDLWILINTLSY